MGLEKPNEVESSIAGALDHDGPALVDTVVSRMGFSLYMLKAVIGGRGDDLIDLARANLWQ